MDALPSERRPSPAGDGRLEEGRSAQQLGVRLRVSFLKQVRLSEGSARGEASSLPSGGRTTFGKRQR